MTDCAKQPSMNTCRCCTAWWCGAKNNLASAPVSGGVNRRQFMAGAGGVAAGSLALSAISATSVHAGSEPNRFPIIKIPLKVQPVLVCTIYNRREGTSWRPWGGVKTETDMADEQKQIQEELAELNKTAAFPMEILPLVTLANPDQAKKVASGDHDVLLMYAATCDGGTLEALTDPKKWTLMFLRHRTGRVYLWYEIVHNRYLRKTVDDFGQPGMTPKDVVVDRYDELEWRLRSLYALKNTFGKKIIAVGGPSGWGEGGQIAPDRTRELWKMELIDESYDDLGKRLIKARQNNALVKRCENDAEQYLKQRGITLDTSKDFVSKAFLLTEVFHDLMAEAKTDAITINECMGTIMQVSETTACMPLSFINDDGYLAFCESDFVVIPSGILLHYLSNKPVFLNDPTYPHDNLVTLAHCTAPRKMDGEHYEPTKVLTHFESDWGAAPKVEMKLGQKITVIDPDFASKRWLGFEGEIVDNPFLDICRSQIDVEINGDCDKLNEETRGFHWMVCYGNYLKETGYALQKAGVDWMNLT